MRCQEGILVFHSLGGCYVGFVGSKLKWALDLVVIGERVERSTRLGLVEERLPTHLAAIFAHMV